MERMESSTEILFEASYIWHEISVGDGIMLEADLEEDGDIKLFANKEYQVLAKCDFGSGAQVFAVNGEEGEEIIYLHPFLICSYTNGAGPVVYC
mgnify:CR=1 FL=1